MQHYSKCTELLCTMVKISVLSLIMEEIFPLSVCQQLYLTNMAARFVHYIGAYVTAGENRTSPISLVCKQGQTLQHTDQTLSAPGFARF